MVNEEYKFNEETIIALRECKKDSKDILNPLNFAFIEIKNADKALFGGWIFSKNTSISLPKIDDQYVYLSNCNCKKSSNSEEWIKLTIATLIQIIFIEFKLGNYNNYQELQTTLLLTHLTQRVDKKEDKGLLRS